MEKSYEDSWEDSWCESGSANNEDDLQGIGILPFTQQRDRSTYNRVFMLLKDAALVMGITFDPLVFVSDFELAMVQASTMSFPYRGCYYHFMQAIWRKV